MRGGRVGVEDHPCGAKGEDAGVALCVVELAEVLLGLRALPPTDREWRFAGEGTIRRFSAVFGVVGQHAALCDGAEDLCVFTVGVDVTGVERENGVGWGVVFDPDEGLDPGVGVVVAGPFDLWRRREGEALDSEEAHKTGADESEGNSDRPAAVAISRGRAGDIDGESSEEHGHDGVGHEVDTQWLDAGDGKGVVAFMREEQDVEAGNNRERNGGAEELTAGFGPAKACADEQ